MESSLPAPPESSRATGGFPGEAPGLGPRLCRNRGGFSGRGVDHSFQMTQGGTAYPTGRKRVRGATADEAFIPPPPPPGPVVLHAPGSAASQVGDQDGLSGGNAFAALRRPAAGGAPGAAGAHTPGDMVGASRVVPPPPPPPAVDGGPFFEGAFSELVGAHAGGRRVQAGGRSDEGFLEPEDPATCTNIGVRGRARLMNDYTQHFVDVGERPQNFIRDCEEDKRFLEYPKLERLMKLKRQVLERRNTPSLCIQANLHHFDWGILGGVKFDVILVDPPWQEYFDRCAAIGATNEDLTPWTLEEMLQLPVEKIGDTPSFCFLWCGVTHLEDARQLLHKWGYRRCEDICWLKTNKKAAQRRREQNAAHVNDVLDYKATQLVHDETSILQRTTEHCLMGIKGTVRRSQDSHFIHANLDTDILISEQEEEVGCTRKPEELYDIIERFCLGRRRIELFGRDWNRRAGWVTVGCEFGLTTFDAKTYASYFDGDVAWPEATDYMGGRYVGTMPEIEQLRPKSPTKFPDRSAGGT
ncbi:N6-adenosine-methyltransferase, putative [Toxoplasma gondii ME49]|uniref:N6-adenosine-methyltransferase, putative n=2 Tax=Toxoplasma gondii TaxID=5811 RepID=S8GII7_TOXGM|nr:N6-adenosine-methyltransferase, putative [Toxoplasma gondii ME49]EPT28274.1 N6-adenosine-methyltransferase, putative [Toxoplasma gondii ME49]KYF47150.1 putative N6-adenosine-methyltransferase [Toxoplasma gondii ARI]|eukprot:XP_002365577.1 N6-adenosine-methyltransferase, putative [Toxoplasma gondii ME49]